MPCPPDRRQAITWTNANLLSIEQKQNSMKIQIKI